MTPEDHLEWLRARHSVREFSSANVPRNVLHRLVEAATSAPSPSNRQPWRFDVVTDHVLREKITDDVRTAWTRMERAIARGPHGGELHDYGDFFWQPLCAASVLIVPQVRPHDGLLGQFLRSAGEEAADWALPSAMQPERCAVSAAVMALLLHTRAEGLEAVWMAGPMIARADIEKRLEIRNGWEMLGLVALGYPAEAKVHTESKPRRALDRVLRWHE